MDDRLTILLVDDDEIERVAVRRALKASSFQAEVLEASSGAEALVALEGNPAVDCVLMDYLLPDHDGLTVLRQARVRGIKTPIIMLTGQGNEEIAVEMMKAGASDYLAKSRISLDGLARSVIQAVRLHRAEQSALAVNAQLRESEERFRLMADCTPMMLWISDVDAKCTYFNDAWLKFVGRTIEQEIGDGWLDNVHPADRQRCMDTFLAHFTARRGFEMEYRLRRFDGEYRWIFDHGMPRYLPDGTFVGYIGSCIDITERREAEQALKKAKETAEAANRAKDQFLAVLSHELRTPLTPVLVGVQSLETQDDLDADVRSTVDMIRRNVELEARLIDDLLDLTRIARGKLELNVQPTDAHLCLQSALDICQPEIVAKKLKVSAAMTARHHIVRADSARLQQVFWNLIKNAVKFTPDGGAITVRSTNRHEVLAVEVIDNGIGIEPQILPRIFDAFEQGEQAITRKFGGLGLGLAISKAMIDAHRGKLTAASKGHDEGATFTVELPTIRDSIELKPETSSNAPTAAASPADGNGNGAASSTLRILMVDDHEDTSRAMQRLLETRGYRVRIANSVATALEAARGDRFDLLISDIGLPDGSGLELIRELRKQYQIPGIALSGFGMEDDIRKSKEAGFGEHLTKPINFMKLQAVISQLMGSESAAK